MTKGLRTNVGIFLERAHFNNFTPRNSRWGGAVCDSLAKILGTSDYPCVEKPKLFDMTLETVKTSLAKLRLGGRKITVDIRDVLRVRPPRAQASLGVTIDCDDSSVITGEKGSSWLVALNMAAKLFRRMQELDLTWDCLNPSSAHVRCQEFNLAFIPLLRLDGKATAPRIIHAGSSAMYPIESALATKLSPDWKATDGLAYSIDRTLSRFSHYTHDRIINVDFSRYDSTQYWEYMVMLYKAVGQLYSIPEWLMVPICAYNIGAPMFIPEVCRNKSPDEHGFMHRPTGRIILVYICGKARSGSGIFPLMNSLGSFVALDITRKALDTEHVFHRHEEGLVNSTCWLWDV